MEPIKAGKRSRDLYQPPPFQRTGSVMALPPEGPGLKHPESSGAGLLKHLGGGEVPVLAPTPAHTPQPSTAFYPPPAGKSPGGPRWSLSLLLGPRHAPPPIRLTPKRAGCQAPPSLTTEPQRPSAPQPLSCLQHLRAPQPPVWFWGFKSSHIP